MNNRERLVAVLNYQSYDRMPLVHFGYWPELLEKWCAEGHVKAEEISGLYDGNEKDMALGKKLGFDFNYYTTFRGRSGLGISSLHPPFRTDVLEEYPDGSYKIIDSEGAIQIQKRGIVSIPKVVGHLLVDRRSWEELYLPKLCCEKDRFDIKLIKKIAADAPSREEPLGIYCGSLFGQIRNWMGIEGVSYLYVDDESLYDEIIDTVGNLSYCVVKKILEYGAHFDFAHYWEDICFKNGPLVSPSVFHAKVGPHYRKISELLHSHGIKIISLDCDGMIDALIPTWVENGVNTMFPIEVGTWNASIRPWREKYGRELRGVGGMDKRVFAYDYGAVDAEIERLKGLVALGGYVPCPDHRIPLDAKWENVQYYCDRMRRLF